VIGLSTLFQIMLNYFFILLQNYTIFR